MLQFDSVLLPTTFTKNAGITDFILTFCQQNMLEISEVSKRLIARDHTDSKIFSANNYRKLKNKIGRI